MYGPKLFIFFDLLSISMSVLTLLSCNLAMGKLMKLKVLSDLYVYLSTSLNWRKREQVTGQLSDEGQREAYAQSEKSNADEAWSHS